MIQETKTYRCRVCDSENIVKNGTNRYGNQQYWCKDCGARRVLNPKRKHPVEKRDGLEDLPGMSLSRFGGQKDKIVNLT